MPLHAPQSTLRTFGVLMLCLLAFTGGAGAQINTYIQSVTPSSATDGSPLRIAVALQKSTEIQRVMLYYRQFGQTQYRVLEMILARDSAAVTIPQEDVAPPFMEVYVVAELTTGGRESRRRYVDGYRADRARERKRAAGGYVDRRAIRQLQGEGQAVPADLDCNARYAVRCAGQINAGYIRSAPLRIHGCAAKIGVHCQ